jgi:pantetheine-phosphate adenylyltransferase
MKVAVYPGSFDPVTKGHLDIVNRASKIFDKVIVAILINRSKNPMFDIEERVALVKESVKENHKIEVDSFTGLLTDYIVEHDIDVIVKGLRAVSDFESEFQMATMNRKLNSKAETFFLTTDMEYAHLSSSLVKEVFVLGGDIKEFVTNPVLIAMNKKRGVEIE